MTILSPSSRQESHCAYLGLFSRVSLSLLDFTISVKAFFSFLPRLPSLLLGISVQAFTIFSRVSLHLYCCRPVSFSFPFPSMLFFSLFCFLRTVCYPTVYGVHWPKSRDAVVNLLGSGRSLIYLPLARPAGLPPCVSAFDQYKKCQLFYFTSSPIWTLNNRPRSVVFEELRNLEGSELGNEPGKGWYHDIIRFSTLVRRMATVPCVRVTCEMVRSARNDGTAYVMGASR